VAGLKTVRRAIAPAARRLSSPDTSRDHDRRRDAETEWRAWYKTQAWHRLRWHVLVRDHFTCRMCQRVEPNSRALVADHIRPHRGDADLFWDEGNLQCMCAACHNSAKQKEERAGGAYSRRPEWLKPSAVPLVIVCGPPAAGKSTWVAARARPGDVVIDLDAIVADVSGQPFTHDWDRFDWTAVAMRRRNEMLADLSRARNGRAWFIVPAPKPEDRQWWAEKLAAEAVVVLAVPVAECKARVLADKGRNAAATMRAVMQWWSDYQPRPGDESRA
jgi:5-methylcytosine-specific restriction endonuclease McrA